MSTQPAPIEIFYSYAHQDENLRTELEKHLSLLQRQGHITSWHDQQIIPGTNRAKTINTHLETATLILLLISSDFLASDYCYSIEMQRALQRHQAKEARVIPILLRPVDNWQQTPFGKLQVLPSQGKPVTKWPDRDDAFADIARGIRTALQQIQPPPTDPPSTILPPTWNIPYPRNPFFTGRDELLTRLSTALKSGQAAALSQAQAISGLGGIGKTQIAVEFAYQHRQDYQTVLWTLADKRESLVSGYIAIAEKLHLPQKDAQEQEITIEAVKTWLQTHNSWLLILDNADDLAMAREFIPTVFAGHLLLTTRAQAMGRLANRIEVETMNQDVGALFLLRRVDLLETDASLDTALPQDQALAREICAELDGLPLALDQAGAFIEETQCSLTEYLRLYLTQRKEILKERGGLINDHPEPVASTWSISFANVRSLNPAAADLLRISANLSPDAIPEELFSAAAQHLGPNLSLLGSDPLSLNKALAVLGTYSLIRRNGETQTLSVHRLVQAVLQDTMNEETQHMWAERAVLAVNEVFPVVAFEVWSQCERYLSHALVCANLVEKEQINNLDAADLLNKAGWYLKDRARYTDAARVYKQALEIRERKLGADHPSTASSLHNLAVLYQNQGKYSEAEELYKRALSIKEQALGAEHPSTGNTLHEMARLYQNQGKYSEAEELYKRALRISEQSEGAEHPSTGTTLQALASLYQEQGKYEQAEALYERALHIHEQALGAEHPSTGNTLHELASLYQEQGKYKQAGPLYERALRISEQSEGAEHPSTGTTLHEMARLYQKQGKYEQAEELYERALRIKEQALGAEHPSTAASLHGLATLLYESLGKYGDAEPLFKRALSIYEQTLGEMHPNTQIVREWYASLLRKMG